MTQLFDTQTYEELDEEVADTFGGRHLRSMPTGGEPAIAGRTTQWRLDDRTIEAGRKGIEAARAALQDAAKTDNVTKNTNTKIRRKAA